MFSGETKEEAIVRLHEQGYNITRIRRLTRISYEKVVDVIKYYEENNEIPLPSKIGRPSKLTNTALTAIAAITVHNRAVACWEISRKLKDQGIICSSTTVFRG